MIQKQNFQNPFIEPPFSLMSKGIGKAYLEKKVKMHHRDLSRNYVTFEDGQSSRLPRYLRDKIYCQNTQEMQNEHFINKADDDFFKEMEEHYKNNSNNFFDYQYQQQRKFEEDIQKSLKTNKF